MGDGGELVGRFGEAPRRRGERVAAGEDHLPDVVARSDVGECPIERLRRQRAGPARADRLAAEAEPAIDRTDADELEQHAVRVAMDEALAGRVRLVADRIGAFPPAW